MGEDEWLSTGEMPPLPSTGAEAPLLSDAVLAQEPTKVEKAPKAETVKKAEAKQRGVTKVKKAKPLRQPRVKRAKTAKTSWHKPTRGFWRRTGTVNGRGVRAFSYRDPGMWVILTAFVPAIIAGVIYVSQQRSRWDTEESITDAPAAVAVTEPVVDEEDLARYLLLEQRAQLPSCDGPPAELVDGEAFVPVDDRAVAFGATVTIRTGDPATVWSVRVCEPRNITHDADGAIPREIDTIEMGLVVRLEDASGVRSMSLPDEALVTGWEFSTSELDSVPLVQSATCGSSWSSSLPGAFQRLMMAERQVKAGAVCTAVLDVLDLDRVWATVRFDDGEVSFSADGLTDVGLFADLAG